MTTTARKKVKELAHDALAAGDALAWFDRVYEQADGETSAVPWADLEPNPSLVSWPHVRDRRRASLVVGCGLGDDAELLATTSDRVTAFDLSPRAIAWSKKRFPSSSVSYEVGDLLAPPAAWAGAFDFVFEAYTVQCFVPGSAERARAASVLRSFLAPGGVLLVVARFADHEPSPNDGPPWPLVKGDLDAAGEGLSLLGWDDFDDAGTRRVRASWKRVV